MNQLDVPRIRRIKEVRTIAHRDGHPIGLQTAVAIDAFYTGEASVPRPGAHFTPTAPRPGIDYGYEGWATTSQVQAEPQLLPSIDTAVFLAEHGVTGPRLARLIPQFSRAVERAYIDEHVAMPPTVTEHIAGVGARKRNVYQGPGDLALMERVFAARFTPELDWVEEDGL